MQLWKQNTAVFVDLMPSPVHKWRYYQILAFDDKRLNESQLDEIIISHSKAGKRVTFE